jgi:hypothetical protein
MPSCNRSVLTGSKLTLANYNEVTDGMTKSQVLWGSEISLFAVELVVLTNISFVSVVVGGCGVRRIEGSFRKTSGTDQGSRLEA